MLRTKLRAHLLLQLRLTFRRDKPVQTKDPLPPIPHNLTVFKGLKNVVLNRTFAEFLVSDNQVVRDFLDWAKEMSVPDESFYSTFIRVDMEKLKRSRHNFNVLEFC